VLFTQFLWNHVFIRDSPTVTARPKYHERELTWDIQVSVSVFWQQTRSICTVHMKAVKPIVF
jgi:hypothetical protein